MDQQLDALTTPEACEALAEEAVRAGNAELGRRARRRSIELQVEINSHGASTNAERESIAAIYAYELVSTGRGGGRFYAGRTWPMLRDGILPAVERLVSRRKESRGYTALLQAGLQEYALEAVVLRYPDQFSASAVERCEQRLLGLHQQLVAEPKGVPDGITREHLLAGIDDLDQSKDHSFGNSTGYDVLHANKRYAPKAVVGLAAERLMGVPYGPYDFKGGLGSKCFRVLAENDFAIVTKGEQSPYPDEIEESEEHSEGAIEKVLVNRYERDKRARDKCIAHYGACCSVCEFDFAKTYGVIGEGFIHVHHTVPLSQIRESYGVDPIKDLKPVCPNCHAMLHKRKHPEPYSIEELRAIMQT